MFGRFEDYIGSKKTISLMFVRCCIFGYLNIFKVVFLWKHLTTFPPSIQFRIPMIPKWPQLYAILSVLRPSGLVCDWFYPHWHVMSYHLYWASTNCWICYGLMPHDQKLLALNVIPNHRRICASKTCKPSHLWQNHHGKRVGGFKHFAIFHTVIYGIILPIDFHIFQDGYCTTNQQNITSYGTLHENSTVFC